MGGPTLSLVLADVLNAAEEWVEPVRPYHFLDAEL